MSDILMKGTEPIGQVCDLTADNVEYSSGVSVKDMLDYSLEATTHGTLVRIGHLRFFLVVPSSSLFFFFTELCSIKRILCVLTDMEIFSFCDYCECC